MVLPILGGELGMGTTLGTFCGHTFGTRQFHILGIYIQQSIVILSATVFLLFIPNIFSEPIFKLLGQSTIIAAKFGVLLKWMLPQPFAFSTNLSMQKSLHEQDLILPIV